MSGTKLILNDGTEIDEGRAGYAGGFLWLWFTGYTLAESAGLFFDSGKTARIVFRYGEMEDVYEGYTNCVNLGIDTDGQVSVCMKRGAENV